MTTKELDPVHEEHLNALIEAHDRLVEARRAQKEYLRDVHNLISEGFKSGIGGPNLAKASGLSLPRVYQIREQYAQTSKS